MNSAPPISRRVPPDPDRMNDDRSNWAETALQAFVDVTGTDREDAVADLLADLMHWCDRNSSLSFDEELARARFHYNAETAGEDGLPGGDHE